MLDNDSGVVEVTSRTLHGRFLMRPSVVVNELILGVLGRAQARYKVEIYAFVFLSNHFHILMRVESARQMAAFVGFLKANIAKELGRIHGWREKFWGRRYHSASVADSEAAQAARFLYILANGSKEGLVSSPPEWPGASSASALYRGESTLTGIWYDRTAEHRARLRGETARFPSLESVRLSPLPFLEKLPAQGQRDYVVKAVRQVERETRERHRKENSQPLGSQRIEKQDPHDKPRTFHASPAPLFHAATRQEFLEMRRARELKVAQYRWAAHRIRRGHDRALFPLGSFPPPPPFVETRAPP